jgi:hypothetical protein
LYDKVWRVDGVLRRPHHAIAAMSSWTAGRDIYDVASHSAIEET